MNVTSQIPIPFLRDEFGSRPALKHSSGEFGESVYRGSDPDSGDSVTLSVSSGEWGGKEIRGSIRGKSVDVYIGRDEFGYEEIRGSGAEEYRRLTRERPDPMTDWM